MPSTLSSGHYCPGCDSIFSRRGFINHQQQTRDPLCQREFTASAWPEHDQISDAEQESDGHLDLDLDHIIPVPFAGDFFGTANDYAEADDAFGQIEMPSNINEDEDEGTSDIEDEVNAELEEGWEAPREDAPPRGEDFGEDGSNDAMEVDVAAPYPVPDDGREVHADDKREAELVLIANGHGITPKKIVRYTEVYPSSHAGDSVGQENTMDSRYVQAINGASNVWAPFNSKVDWEVAQWAKLRGLGSTAFSDLLAIEGVILMFCFYIHDSSFTNDEF